MVEVFKTNVASHLQEANLVRVIEGSFEGYKANFDIDDCDHILRIESVKNIEVTRLICFLKDIGVMAEVLPDEVEDIDFLLPGDRLIIR